MVGEAQGREDELQVVTRSKGVLILKADTRGTRPHLNIESTAIEHAAIHIRALSGFHRGMIRIIRVYQLTRNGL